MDDETAFNLASGSPPATGHTVEVAFFTTVRTGIEKLDANRRGKHSGASDFAVQQLVNNAVASTEVVDILEPKFSSWSLIPVSLGRCFHAISIR